MVTPSQGVLPVDVYKEVFEYLYLEPSNSGQIPSSEPSTCIDKAWESRLREQCRENIFRPYRIDSLFDPATQEQQLSGYSYPGYQIAERVAAFSPNNTQYAEASSFSIYVKDRKRRPDGGLGSFQLMAGNEGQQGAISNINFSSDGKLLVSAGENHTIKIWDIEKQRCTKTLWGHNSPTILAVFGPHNKQIASADSEGNLKIWDAEQGDCKKTLASSGDCQEIVSIAFSQDGTKIVSAYSNGLLKVWDIESEKSIDFQADCQKRLNFVKFSPDGRYIEWDSSLIPDCPEGFYASGKAEIYVWNASNGERLPNRSVTRDDLQFFSLSPKGVVEVRYKASSPVELLIKYFADYPRITLPVYWSSLPDPYSRRTPQMQLNARTEEAIALIFNTTMATLKGLQRVDLDNDSYSIYLQNRLSTLNRIAYPAIKQQLQSLFNQVLKQKGNPFSIPINDQKAAWLQKWQRAVEKWDKPADWVEKWQRDKDYQAPFSLKKAMWVAGLIALIGSGSLLLNTAKREEI